MQLGFELALAGITTVFIFLVLLILLMTLMSKIIMAYENKDEQKQVNYEASPLSDELLRRIVTDAVRQHRSKNTSA
ncbi:MAG: hypothetical protein GY694_06120 [Gammaproteobacteria bacterium]|nr:hypothetical protein [Gammaproteobacteria bacterium]